MRKTCIISDKGGDTKSTTTNAAATGINYLGKKIGNKDKNYKALAVTMEPSGHLPYFFGLDSEVYPTVYHVAKGEISFSDAIQHTDRGDILNGNAWVNGIDTLWKTTDEKQRVFCALRDGLNEVQDQYSHVFIDCKPLTGGTLTIQSLIACDDVIIPMKASAASLKSLMILYKAIGEIKAAYNPNIRVAGVLITRFKYTSYEKGIIQNLNIWAKINNTKVYKAFVPDGIGIEEAQGSQQNIYEYKYGFGKDKPANAYLEFLKEYLKEEGN